MQPTRWRSRRWSASLKSLAAHIPDLPQIVAFRNQLIHGYATVNVGTVWNVTQNALPPVATAVQALLDELGDA